jgi:ABC-type bacteriocin/lantibiotic exporter with double-glycine peptidase domain
MNEVGKDLHCHVDDFRSVDDLRDKPPVLVIINLEGNLAHYVVVLAFDGKVAHVADPLAGDIARMPRAALERNWTGRVILCDRG